MLFEVNEEKQNLEFFRKIEENLKCNFKYTNMIMNNSEESDTFDDDMMMAAEVERVEKIEKNLK